MNPIVRKIHSDPGLRRKIREACEAAGEPLTSQALHYWKKLRQGVPPGRVVIVSRVLGIPPSEIRPDIFPPARRRSKSKRSKGPLQDGNPQAKEEAHG